MASIYSTGPAYVYIGFLNKPEPLTTDGEVILLGDDIDIFFLGTCEDAPEIELQPIYVDVRSDTGGVSVPFDKIFDGQTARILLPRMNRFNWDVYKMLQGVPNVGLTNNMAKNVAGDIGALMLREGSAVGVWIVFPYADPFLAFGTPEDMPRGYHFPGGLFVGPNNLKPGTEDLKNSLLFQAIPVFDKKDGSFTLYDTDEESFVDLPEPD